MDRLQAARDLIAIDATTGNEEPIVAYLEGALAALGLEPRSEQVAPGRRNLIAGPENPAVLFCTHTDTVPPHLPFREDDEHFHGRGACDTKGITACFLEASRRLLERGERDFGLLFVVGEEVDNAGARHANKHIRADYIVVGEPTENRLAIGHKGFIGARIHVEGVPCHSAYPEQGDSALHRLLRGLDRLMRSDFGHSEILGPGSVNIGVVKGGVAGNVLAPSAEATVTIRVVESLEDAERKLAAALADPASGAPDPKVTITPYTRMGVPKLERIDGFEECVVSYGTDLPFLAAVGKPLLYGPGSILDAHTDHEKISKRQMERAVRDYVDIATRLIARRRGAGG